MRPSERLLLALSRAEDSPEYEDPAETLGIDRALDLMLEEYPGFGRDISGRTVADFGCGHGLQALAMARDHRCTVVGIDTNPDYIEHCRMSAATAGLPTGKCRFVTAIDDELRGRFEIVVSLNSFEHFPEPEAALRQMTGLLAPNGRIYVTFGPPWFAPYGSHMHFFCRVPWLNLLFSERTVMSVRSRFRDDGALRYEEVTSGLNRMSIAKFNRIVAASDLRVHSLRLRGVKGLDIVGSLPVLRELLVNRVTAVLCTRC